MGARPLRRAIQRYIEDPLADEVLRAGAITPGTTVMVDRDESGDEEDKPLKLKLVKPRKPRAKKKEPAAVGARGDDEPEDEAGGRARRGRSPRQSQRPSGRRRARGRRTQPTSRVAPGSRAAVRLPGARCRPAGLRESGRWRRPRSTYVCQSAPTRRSRGRGGAPAAASGTRWSSGAGARGRRAGARPRAARGRGRKPVALRDVATPRGGAARAPASASSIASSAAASCPARWCCWAARRGSASRRSPAWRSATSPPPGADVLYVSGEESAAQVRLRAERLGEGALDGPGDRRDRRSSRSLATIEAERPQASA